MIASFVFLIFQGTKSFFFLFSNSSAATSRPWYQQISHEKKASAHIYIILNVLIISWLNYLSDPTRTACSETGTNQVAVQHANEPCVNVVRSLITPGRGRREREKERKNNVVLFRDALRMTTALIGLYRSAPRLFYIRSIACICIDIGGKSIIKQIDPSFLEIEQTPKTQLTIVAIQSKVTISEDASMTTDPHVTSSQIL